MATNDSIGPFSTSIDPAPALPGASVERARDVQRDLNGELQKSTQLSRQFGSAFGTAFEGLALRGRGLAETVRSLGQSLSSIAFRAAFKPLEQSIGGVLEKLVRGAAAPGAGGLASSASAATLGFTYFAKGGVIAAPVGFPLGNGVGVAGESGPEAIMPLSRGPDGRLGVAATAAPSLNVVFNVTATDAGSFARSESQIAALLARAVSSGQRNL